MELEGIVGDGRSRIGRNERSGPGLLRRPEVRCGLTRGGRYGIDNSKLARSRLARGDCVCRLFSSFSGSIAITTRAPRENRVETVERSRMPLLKIKSAGASCGWESARFVVDVDRG